MPAATVMAMVSSGNTGPTMQLQIRMKPRSRASSLEQSDDGTWLARVKSPPVDGQANAELVKLVAKHFGCAKSAVRIKSGASSRLKKVEVDAANAG